MQPVRSNLSSFLTTQDLHPGVDVPSRGDLTDFGWLKIQDTARETLLFAAASLDRINLRTKAARIAKVEELDHLYAQYGHYLRAEDRTKFFNTIVLSVDGFKVMDELADVRAKALSVVGGEELVDEYVDVFGSLYVQAFAGQDINPGISRLEGFNRIARAKSTIDVDMFRVLASWIKDPSTEKS